MDDTLWGVDAQEPTVLGYRDEMQTYLSDMLEYGHEAYLYEFASQRPDEEDLWAYLLQQWPELLRDEGFTQCAASLLHTLDFSECTWRPTGRKTLVCGK